MITVNLSCFVVPSEIQVFNGSTAVGAEWQLARLTEVQPLETSHLVRATFEVSGMDSEGPPWRRSRDLLMSDRTAVRTGVMPPRTFQARLRSLMGTGRVLPVSTGEFLIRSGPAGHDSWEEGVDLPGAISLNGGVSADLFSQLHELPMTPTTRTILTHRELKPQSSLSAGPFTFFMGPVIRVENDRLYAIALVPVRERTGVTLKRRFFYKSHSGGNWRATPFVTEEGHLVKGTGRHYTAETQLAPELERHLQTLEREAVPLPFKNLIPLMRDAGPLVSAEERFDLLTEFGRKVRCTPVTGSGVCMLRPGAVFAQKDRGDISIDRTLSRRLESLRYPRGFTPDFTRGAKPIDGGTHSKLGQITLREYEAVWEDRKIIWTMEEDSEGRTWCRSIRFRDAVLTSFGVYSEAIDSGVLTSKPLDYKGQVVLLPPEERFPFDDVYSDITPALCRLKPMRAYRRARGLPPIFAPVVKRTGAFARVPGDGMPPSAKNPGKFYIGSDPGAQGYQIPDLRMPKHATVYATTEGYYIRGRDSDRITLVSRRGGPSALVRSNSSPSRLNAGDVVSLGEAGSDLLHLAFILDPQGIGTLEPFTPPQEIPAPTLPDSLTCLQLIPGPFGPLAIKRPRHRELALVFVNNEPTVSSIIEIHDGDIIHFLGGENRYQADLAANRIREIE